LVQETLAKGKDDDEDSDDDGGFGKPKFQRFAKVKRSDDDWSS
jgi:hypothetical protein